MNHTKWIDHLNESSNHMRFGFLTNDALDALAKNTDELHRMLSRSDSDRENAQSVNFLESIFIVLCEVAKRLPMPSENK